jgi:DNA-3-methyladenine glycosylase II
MYIACSPAYRFDLLLKLRARYQYPSLFRVVDDHLWQTMRHDDHIYLLDIHAVDGGLMVDILAQEADAPAPDPDRLRATLVQVLGCERDLSDFYAIARADAPLWQVVEPLHGLPLTRAESVYQALMFVIIEQHISWVVAQKAQRTLVEWGNQHVLYDGTPYYAMPRARQIASATLDDLYPLKVTRRRRQWLIDISGQVVGGTLDLDTPRTPATLYDDLMAIKGVGHWTAAVVIGRAVGAYRYVAHKDVALQRAINRYFYDEDDRASPSRVTATCQRYGDYAGFVAHFTMMRWVLEQYEQTQTDA